MESESKITHVGIPQNIVATLQPDAPLDVELVHVFDKMKSVKGFIFDMDGVLTNNDLLVTEAGELLRKMNVRDGQAIKWAVEAGYPVCVITGGRSDGAKLRLNNLGVEEYYSGVKDKNVAFQSFIQRSKLQPLEVCYMGDDLPDMPVLRKVSFSCCPADAVPEVKAICDYISRYNGGAGCVREIIECVMKLQKKWPKY